MQSLGIPESLYKWISYYLKGRTFQVRIGAELGSIHLAKGGTPQGSPLSVPLWHIFFSDIPEESQALLFMDDICLFGHNRATVQKRLDVLSNWAATNHIDWNLEKYVVLPTKAGTVPMITLHGHKLKVVETARYLGILFSSSQSGIGFSFQAEAEKLRGIITSRANWLKLLSHAPLGVVASAYRSLVQSRICFTIPFLQDHLVSVEKSQQQSLRIICKSLPGVPWARLYNATGIPPIESLFWSSWPGVFSSWANLPDNSPQWTAYRQWIESGLPLYDLTPFGNIRWSESTISEVLDTEQRNDLTGPYLDHKCTQIPPQLIDEESSDGESNNNDIAGKPENSTQYVETEYPPINFCKTASSIDLSTQTLTKNSWTPDYPPPLEQSKHYACYTDGSWSSKTFTGAASCLYSNMTGRFTTYSLKIFPTFSAYAVELRALQLGAQQMARICPPGPPIGNTVTFFTDCASIISGFPNWIANGLKMIDEVRLDIVDSFDVLRENGYTVRLRWLPGHQQIALNEEVDSTAKRVLHSNCRAIPIPIGPDWYRQQRKKLLRKPCADPRGTAINALSKAEFKRLSLLSGHRLQQTLRLLCNHAKCNRIWWRKLDESDPDPTLCPCCQRQTQDVCLFGHLSSECEPLAQSGLLVSFYEAVPSLQWGRLDNNQEAQDRLMKRLGKHPELWSKFISVLLELQMEL